MLPTMAPGFRSTFSRMLVCVMAIAVFVAGCSFVEAKHPPGQTASVSEDKAGDVVSEDGSLRVHVPAGAVEGEGVIRVEPATGPDGQPGWSIDLEGAELVGEAALRFEVPALEEGEPVPLISYNVRAGDPLVPVAGTVVNGHVVVTTDHFSNWFVDRWADLRDRSIPVILDRLDRLLSTSGEGKHPNCEDEQSVREEQYQVTSDSGRRVYWCLGREDAQVVLKAVNARGYGVAAEYTPGMSLMAADGRAFFASLASSIKASPHESGNSVETVPPGSSVTFGLQPTEMSAGLAGVTLRADPAAYLLTAFWFGIETVTMLLETYGAGDKSEAILNALRGATCVDAAGEMVTPDITSAVDAHSFFSDALTVSFDCIGAVIRDYDFGVVLNGFVSPLLWLWSGVLTAVNGFVAAADTGSELFGVAGYTIVIEVPHSDAAPHRGEKPSGTEGPRPDHQSSSDWGTEVTDPIGDAPADTDVGSVRFFNTGDSFTASIEIPGLGRTGRVMLAVAAHDYPDPEAAALEIRAVRNRAGLTGGVYYYRELQQRLPCPAEVAWDTDSHTVSVSAEKECLLEQSLVEGVFDFERPYLWAQSFPLSYDWNRWDGTEPVQVPVR